MRTIYAALAALSLMTIVGCQVSSPQGGGLAPADGFNLVVPVPNTGMELQQGAIQTINVNISRGYDFKQDVKIEVTADKGIKVDPGSIIVKASDQASTLVRISADKNTAVGDYRVTFVGTPTTGDQTRATIVVKVVPVSAS